MKLIQLYKTILLVLISSCILFPESINPSQSSKEEKINLVVDTEKGTKERRYYLVDDGLQFTAKDFMKKGFEIGDRINLQIMSRTYLASSNNKNKKFQFELIIKRSKDHEPVKRNLTYSKKTSSATSPNNKKGFSFTYAGYWFEDLKLTEDLQIYIKAKENRTQKVYVRVIGNKNLKKKRTKKKITPIDHQKNITITSESNSKELKVKKDWYLITKNNKQQFKLDSNASYEVFTRLIIDEDLEVQNNTKYYKLNAYENNQKLATYIMEGNLSITNAKIKNDYNDLEGKLLSKYSSFFISVPQAINKGKKYSYYTFKVPKNSEDRILIKILKYGSK